MIKELKRANERRALKQEKKKLIHEIGISMTTFKKKMPRVVMRKNNVWDVADPKKGEVGKKMSLRQQVVWLREFAEATRELRKEMKELKDKKDEIKKEEPTFQPVNG